MSIKRIESVNIHKKCQKIKVKMPPNWLGGIYNIIGFKRCTHCNIFSNDSVFPGNRCPCCGKLFKRNARWRTHSANYGAKAAESKVAANNVIKNTNKKAGRMMDK